jgi:putative Holliday junction resolvase
MEDFSVDKYRDVNRALCLDHGTRRIGVAISDIKWIISSPLTVLESCTVFKNLIQIVKEKEVGLIVVGRPVSLNGGFGGTQMKKVMIFVEKLCSLTDVDVILWDERLSTAGAINSMKDFKISQKKSRSVVDKIAASFILSGFLAFSSTRPVAIAQSNRF